jgi:hypothetical protein
LKKEFTSAGTLGRRMGNSTKLFVAKWLRAAGSRVWKQATTHDKAKCTRGTEALLYFTCTSVTLMLSANSTHNLRHFAKDVHVSRINTPVLVNNQPDVLFHVFIYSFHPSTCLEHQALIIRR